MNEITLDVQIEAARKELAMRLRIYPRLVENELMALDAADKDIAVMQAIVDTLEALAHFPNSVASMLILTPKNTPTLKKN